MSFDPFAVQCPTCGSRLRVSDPAIVDTIATCPKCSSMVQIQRPSTAPQPIPQRPGRQVAVGQSDVDSQAITEDGIAPDEEGCVAAEDMPVGFSGSEGLDGGGSPVSAVPPQWQSDRTRRSRQIALVVAVSLSGLLTAVAVFSWFVRAWRQESAATTVESVSSAAEQPSVEAPKSTNGDETDSATSPPIESVSPRSNLYRADPPGDSVETPRSLDPHVDGPVDAAPIPHDLLPTSPITEPVASEANIADSDTAAVPAEDDLGSMQELPPELAQLRPSCCKRIPAQRRS